MTVTNGFRLEREQVISELRSTACLFTHVKTGARLVHLRNDDANNLFSIAFRTPVSDSTGVPHILEHSVLCGSKKFPVKDPFQEMLKGSLQTFLNALTYPDKTVYPVSSQVEKDFYNLVDVYCDAVLNPLITENTFYQEGWHFDIENIDEPVGIKGIVYNEMKGVFSDFASHVGRRTIAKLFPDTSYSHESGGDPEFIPDLTFEQFREFHRKFYHPSNAYIFLYGNLPTDKTLKFLDENYLREFDKLDAVPNAAPQIKWDAPKTVTINAPAPLDEDGCASVICAWIFGESADPVTVFSGSILSHYFLSTESSPLRRALIDSDLGEDLDDMSGFDSDLAQCVFSAGLRKSKPENAQKILDIILDTIRNEVERGLDAELIEGALRQTEFHLREIINGHFPYNLRLADRCYRPWINGGDPFALLAFEKPFAYIKEEVRKGGFFERVVKERMLDNTHRLLSVIVASAELGEKFERHSEEQAKKLTKHFTDDDKKRYIKLTKALREEQGRTPSAEARATLPTLSKNDLPKRGRVVPVERGELSGVPIFAHPIFTSGVSYIDIGFDFRGAPRDLVSYIPLYLELLTRCGANGQPYERMAKRISLATGGIDATVSCKTRVGTQDDILFFGFLHGKSLDERFPEMLEILEDLLLAPDLKNRKQVKDLLLEERNALSSSIIHSGHSYAVTHASARLSKSRAVDEQLGGITQLRFLDAIVKNENYGAAIEGCVRLHDFFINRGSCVISMTATDPSKLTKRVEEFICRLPVKTRVVDDGGVDDKNVTSKKNARDKNAVDNKKIARDKKVASDNVISSNDDTHNKKVASDNVSNSNDDTHNKKVVHNIGIEIGSAVNFVARAWRLGAKDAAQSGKLFLLSRNLSTGYLWDKIRVEGGAYGGMSGMSVAHPVFTCASYRDPNLDATLDHFVCALKEAAGGISKERVDQSVIGAIGRVDQPKTPHAQGMGETMDLLVGCTTEFRQTLRDAVLGATPQDLQTAAETVLSSEESAITVLGSASSFDKTGLVFEREKLV